MEEEVYCLVAMTLDLSKVDALYFRKEKVLDIITHMYYLYNVNEKAGKRVTSTWQGD